jgi:hypothetical protein
MNFDTGSLSRTLPSSTSIITATPVMGFDMDASRKMLSFAIGLFASMSAKPWASKYAILPRRATRVTAPATLRESM